MVITAEQIDALLPQTQCGQCGYGGCMPYAQAIQKGEAINKCPPGGITTLLALANLLNKDPAADIEVMRLQEKPLQQAIIKADECIGCTKCIQACPVDAIVGAAKQLHVIIQTECTGCGLCVTPCPVDCIAMIDVSIKQYTPAKARQRFQARNRRLQKVEKVIPAKLNIVDNAVDAKKAYIQAAVLRAKNKKLSSN